MDNELDRAIDDVAREMTAGDADANLRARVLADVERPRPVAWRPVFAAACGVAALVVLAFITSRSHVPSSSHPVGRPPVVAEKEPSPAPPSVGAELAPPVASVGAELAPAIASRTRVPSASGPASVVYQEPPLEQDPIVVAPITVAPIEPAALRGAEELPSLAPIAVAPLDAQGESR